MAYEKQLWNDRQVEKPLTFTMTNNDDGTVTLTPAPGKITNEGDPMSAERLNHMEDGIAQINDLQGVVKSNDFALITAQVITPQADDSTLTGNTTVIYPDGFTKNNCIVVGLMGNNPAKDTDWTTVVEPTSLGYITGSGGLMASLMDNGILLQRTKSDTIEPSSTSNIKVVLMKLVSNDISKDNQQQDSAETKLRMGDVNGDGKINKTDYDMIQQYYVGTGTLTEEQEKRADVDGDGEITTNDALWVSKHYDS